MQEYSGIAISAFPISIPTRLIQAFIELKADPILVGGAAVQVWTGLSHGVYITGDLDFITHIWLGDFPAVGIPLEKSGRHIFIDGVPIEFPEPPLAVGSLYLDPKADSVVVPTKENLSIRCLRPEACLLDRLAQTAGWAVPETYFQALAIAKAQSKRNGWDQALDP